MTPPPVARAGNGPVLILGALSDVGRAVARAFGQDGHPLILAARRPDRLEDDARDLTLRYGVPVRVVAFDALDTGSHPAFLDSLGCLPDIAVCVVGLLGQQKEAERSWPAADLILRTNYLGPASVLGELANRMEARGRGCIVGVSSVAGERGSARPTISTGRPRRGLRPSCRGCATASRAAASW